MPQQFQLPPTRNDWRLLHKALTTQFLLFIASSSHDTTSLAPYSVTFLFPSCTSIYVVGPALALALGHDPFPTPLELAHWRIASRILPIYVQHCTSLSTLKCSTQASSIAAPTSSYIQIAQYKSHKLNYFAVPLNSV